MRIIGYCVKCHRVKAVRVSQLRPGTVQLGICRDCEGRS